MAEELDASIRTAPIAQKVRQAFVSVTEGEDDAPLPDATNRRLPRPIIVLHVVVDDDALNLDAPSQPLDPPTTAKHTEVVDAALIPVDVPSPHKAQRSCALFMAEASDVLRKDAKARRLWRLCRIASNIST